MSKTHEVCAREKESGEEAKAAEFRILLKKKKAVVCEIKAKLEEEALTN